MCRRRSVVETDILYLIQDMRPDKRAERAARQYIDLSPEAIFQKETEIHEVVERRTSVAEFDKHVDIALVCLCLSHERPENANPLNSQPVNVVSVFLQGLLPWMQLEAMQCS
jgi:hypothetical protein